MMLATTRFVHFSRTDDDHRVVIAGRFAIDQPLGTAGRLAAHHANGLQLFHVLCLGQQQWHAAKRLTAEIGVQPGDKNPLAYFQDFKNIRDLALEAQRIAAVEMYEAECGLGCELLRLRGCLAATEGTGDA